MSEIAVKALSTVLTNKQQDFILTLSNEIKSQDNLATTSPYVIINTQNRVQVRPRTHADKYVLYLDFETKVHTYVELLDYVEDDFSRLHDYLDREFIELIDFPELRAEDFDIDEEREEFNLFIESHSDMDIIYYDEELEASKNDINVFFTRKAYDKHIEANSYHYNKPKSYLKGLFRNPEMEGVLDIVHTLAQAIDVERNNICLYSRTISPMYRTGCDKTFVNPDYIDVWDFCPACGKKILIKEQK
jgi:hypothetical protein